MNFTAILYGIIGALLAGLLMYLDTKLLDNPKSRATYVKGMFMTGLVVGFLIHFFERGFGGGGGTETAQFLPGLGEEIITGPPTF